MKPLVWHRANRRSILPKFRDLWTYRNLLRIWAHKDFTVRYRQSLVGVAWAAFQPALSTLVFVILFGVLRVQSFGNDLPPHGLIVVSGYLAWAFFSAVVAQSSASLVFNSHLLGKVYFPRMILPIASSYPNIVDHLVGLTVFGVGCVYYQFVPPLSFLAIPLFFLLNLYIALSLGIFLSAVNALYRDVAVVVPFLLQFGFFASPVLYHTRMVDPQSSIGLIVDLNPMTAVIEGYRWCMLGMTPATGIRPFLFCLLESTTLFLIGTIYFQRVESHIADRI